MTLTRVDARRSGFVRAIEDTSVRHAVTVPGEVAPAAAIAPKPTRRALVAEFMAGLIRNVVGAGLLSWGAIKMDDALTLAFSPKYDVTMADALRFGIPAAATVLGLWLLMPKQTETFLRFFGMSGIADRLPFLKPKTAPAQLPLDAGGATDGEM